MAKILVADDTVDSRLLLEYELEDEHYEVVSASDGPSAIEVAEAERPDLLLLDIMMPGLDGIQVCRHLKAQPLFRLTPIILISANDLCDEIVEGLDAGATDYVVRPFDLTVMMAKVRAALRDKAAVDELLDEIIRLTRAA